MELTGMRGSALVAGSVTWLLPVVLAAQEPSGEVQLHEGSSVSASEQEDVSPVPPPAPTPAEVQAEQQHDLTTAELRAGGSVQVDETLEADAHASAAAPPAAAERRWPEPDELRLAHNTWLGSTGGVRVIDGGSGAPGTLRFQLGFDYFGASDFLEVNDKHRYTSGTLTIGATPIEHLEVYGSATSYASSNNSGNPILLQSAGNFSLGAKGYVNLLPWLAVGADVRGLLLNAIGDVGVKGSSLSAALRVAGTVDFRRLDALQLPLVFRANVGYFLDNSSKLIEDTENARYNAIPSSSRRPLADEDRHLINRIERFGLGINRVDLMTLGVGVEAPFKLAEDFFLQPLAEWQLGVPVNRQGYDCLAVPTDATNKSSDGCLAVNGLSAAPSTLTVGARVLPPVHGLSALVAVDIGLLGTSTFVRELAPTRPWALLVSVGYAADTNPNKARVKYVERPVEVAQVQQPRAAASDATVRVRGEVIERGSGKPVIGAVVRYPGREFTPQLTSADGVFISYALPDSESSLSFEITHPDYESTQCVVPLSVAAASAAPAATAAAPRSGLAPLAGSGEPIAQAPPTAASATPAPAVDGLIPGRCELTAIPLSSNLLGTVTDSDGKALPGVQVELTGPAQRTLTSGNTGEIKAEALPAGEYYAQVNVQEYLFKRVPVTIVSRNDATVRLSLTPRPRKPQVILTSREVKIGTEVVFRPSSADIDARSTTVLAEVADVLAHNPQIRVQVQGHTDNSGEPGTNRMLSQRRADSVRQWLINAGIEAARIEAKGYGDEQPIVPNLTPESRARNRRVQFTLLKP
jgi:outer membrane protein OmpA-like peptidoglycan-associated protein